MFTVRRWWDRKGLQISLLAVVVGGAWALRQTQGELLTEAYETITRPLQMLQLGSGLEERGKDARVLELQTRIVELESQNQKLKDMLGYVENKQGENAVRPIPARVVGRSADNWWQQVLLNRGRLAGIQEGYIVKADGGLVGRVEKVSDNTSTVLLISDLNSKVGATIPRTNAKGMLRGDGSAEAVLEFYEKVPNVKPGDLVSTSTYSQIYPAGWAIGKIKSLDLQKLPAPVAKIELFPPIRSLDWVTVYPKPENPQPEATKQENKQPEQQQPQKSN